MYILPPRKKNITPAAAAHLLPGTAFNLIARTTNAAVMWHLDSCDGPYSVIIWQPAGQGNLRGGAFCVPHLGLRFIPLNCTILVLSAAVLPHGSCLPVPERGSTAARVGLSAFMRTADLRVLVARSAAAGGADRLKDLQDDVEDDLVQARRVKAKLNVRAAGLSSKKNPATSMAPDTVFSGEWVAPKPGAILGHHNFLTWRRYS